MYTKAQATERINSDRFQIELKIDTFLKEHYVGEEICINLDEYGWDLYTEMENLYTAAGWNVRPPNINPNNAKIMYFK